MHTSVAHRRPSIFIHEHVSGGGMAGHELPPSWLAEGRAMLESVIAAFSDIGCRVIATHDARFAPPPAHETIAVDDASEVPSILTAMQGQTDHGLGIAPEADGVLAELARRADQVPGWNLGCSAAAVEIFGDKMRSAEAMKHAGIAHPPPVRADSPAAPIDIVRVVKPVDGAGSLDTFRICPGTSVKDLMRAVPSIPVPDRFVVQPYVQGVSASVSFLCDGYGGATPVTAFRHSVRYEDVAAGIERIVHDEGEAAGDLDLAAIANTVSSVLKMPGLRGWVGVDLVIDPESAAVTAIEVNPRLTSAWVWNSNRTDSSRIAARWLAFLSVTLYDRGSA